MVTHLAMEAGQGQRRIRTVGNRDDRGSEAMEVGSVRGRESEGQEQWGAGTVGDSKRGRDNGEQGQ